MLLAQTFGWTYDDIQEAPGWWVDRALLWLDVVGEVRGKQSKSG